jgi:hypothetical protein
VAPYFYCARKPYKIDQNVYVASKKQWYNKAGILLNIEIQNLEAECVYIKESTGARSADMAKVTHCYIEKYFLSN